MFIIKLILTTLAFIVVLIGAYYSCRWVASLQTGIQQSRHMKIKDKLMLSKDQSIQIVQIGSQYLLVGVTNDGISILKELDVDEIESADVFVNQHDITAMDSILKTAFQKLKSLYEAKGKPQLKFIDILKEKQKIASKSLEEKIHEN